MRERGTGISKREDLVLLQLVVLVRAGCASDDKLAAQARISRPACVGAVLTLLHCLWLHVAQPRYDMVRWRLMKSPNSKLLRSQRAVQQTAIDRLQG